MIFNLSDRTQLELTGADRAKFLHGFCTNDIKRLIAGQGCEAFVCNLQGKVLGHLFVFCTEIALWIDTVAGQEDVLFQHLDRYLINEDVQIHRRSAEYGDLYLYQTNPDDVFPQIPRGELDRLAAAPVLAHVTLGNCQFRKVDWLGEPGWLVSAPRETLSPAELMGPLDDPQLWDALRISAGFPLYGLEITSENLAQEVNRTERCISFQKGCYLGQEPIARIDALGHVNRELHRLIFPTGPAPAPGTPLRETADGPQIGVVTSAAELSGQIVALGYLRTKHTATGTQVLTPDGSKGSVL